MSAEEKVRPRIRRVVVGLLVVAACVLVPLAVSDLRREDDRSGAVKSVALLEATRFFELDHRDPEASVDRVLELATGRFRKEYGAQKATIIDSVRSQKLQASATVHEDGVAISELTERRAVVLVAVDVSSRSVEGTDERHYRTKLFLRHVDGRWLVEDLKQVG